MTAKKRKNHPKLSSRISFVFVMATLIISIFTIFVSRVTQTNFLEGQAKKKYEQFASILLISSLDAIITEDVNLLANIVKEIGRSDADIALLRVTNEDGKTLAMWENHRQKSEYVLPIRINPIVIEGKEKGKIELLVDLSRQYQQIDAFVFRNSLITIVLLIGLLGIQLVIVRKEAIEPIELVEKRLLEIEVGDFRENCTVGETREIVQLSRSLNKVSKTLKEQRSAERKARFALESLNNAYVRFVPKAFLDQLEKKEITSVELGDHKSAYISILFSDIRSFTTMAERMTVDETFIFINEYLAELGPVVRKNHGFIDKYIGDAIMAIFTTADDAVKAGTDMFLALERFNAERCADEITIGVGIHTGEVMLGTIGEKSRMEGTVIGDVVNLAARLENLTKDYPSSLLISAQTKKELSESERYEIIFVDEVLAKGKSIPTKIYGVEIKSGS
ncbi:MAG: hypothetical protein CL916_10385 [Deltaproteobacteria bacterium]|nr:hypothetical protein [Deltaproteobacteria bacterium]